MSYTLIRECAIILIYKGIGYRLDALSDFEFSQTFSRNSSLRKTLHSKIARPNTLANAKNAASFSMSVLATDTYVEGVFFEIAGWKPLGKNVYEYPETLTRSPESCDIFIVGKNQLFKVSNAYIENVDVAMGVSSPLRFEVSFTASDISPVTTVPLTSGLQVQGDPLLPSPVQFMLNNTLINHIVNAGISSQQVVTWRNERGLHDIGSIYAPRSGILTEASLTASITTHLNKKIKTPDVPFLANVRLQQSGLLYDLRSVQLAKRVTPEDVFQESFDLALTESSNKLVVEYGGLLV
jgi:hypothetical protein